VVGISEDTMHGSGDVPSTILLSCGQLMVPHTLWKKLSQTLQNTMRFRQLFFREDLSIMGGLDSLVCIVL